METYRQRGHFGDDADGVLTLSESDAVGGRRFRNVHLAQALSIPSWQRSTPTASNSIRSLIIGCRSARCATTRRCRACDRRGRFITAGDFIEYAESVGLMPKIDNLLLFRCVEGGRAAAIEEPRRRPVLQCQRIDAQRSVVLPAVPRFHGRQPRAQQRADVRIHARSLSRVRAVEHESLAALADASFGLPPGSCRRPAHEPEELADRSFRFLEVPAKPLA